MYVYMSAVREGETAKMAAHPTGQVNESYDARGSMDEERRMRAPQIKLNKTSCTPAVSPYAAQAGLHIPQPAVRVPDRRQYLSIPSRQRCGGSASMGAGHLVVRIAPY